MTVVYKNVLVHRNTPDLTYHESVVVPDIVPANLDCNDSASIGRAWLRRHEDTGDIYADLHLVDSLKDLKEPLDVLLAAKGATLMEFEGTNYLMKGRVSAVAYMSGAPLAAPPLDPEDHLVAP